MIVKTRQIWKPGCKVNVGFMRGLLVVAAQATPGDFLPDRYLLMSDKAKLYCFTPHNGIESLDLREAAEIYNGAEARITRPGILTQS